MKTVWGQWIFALAAVLCTGQAVAMTMEVQENTAFLAGAVDGTELNKLRDVLDNNHIERIVFVNSPGGDLWTGMRVGRLIASRNLPTVVAGQCSSACSIMFMGGSERRFADTFPSSQTYVGIHGPHNKVTKQVEPGQAGQIYAFLAQRMGDKFNRDLINTALFEMDDAGAMLYVFEPQRSPAKAPVHCRSEQMVFSACTKMAGNNAQSIGLVTDVGLVSVNLPESMREVARIPGGILKGNRVDLAVLFPELVKTQCQTETCTKGVSGFLAQKNHRAIAFPLQGTGYGGSWGQDSAYRAYLSAIYLCNHIKDKPARLCQVRVVNDLDVQSDAQASTDEHAKALAELHLPKEKLYANEQYGGGFTRFSAMRADKMYDMTPQELPQIKTVATQELAELLLAPDRPAVIDVTAADNTLPTALPLVHGGFAFQDAEADDALDKRIVALMHLLSPDPNRRLVIVGYDRQDWRGVNAAMRAKRAGYANVVWYRGGLTAWREANLPTARANFQAVAY